MPAGQSDDMWVGAKHDPSLTLPPDMQHELDDSAHASELPAVYEGKATMQSEYVGDDFPTLDELNSLRRVAAKIPWKVYTIAFVELCERFSFYGTQILFQNFIQRHLMTPTGAAPNPGGSENNNPGALGQGQQTATGLGTFFSFWCYVCPLLGAWIADTYLGRYKTIMISIGFAIVGHVILTAGAAPSVLAHTNGALAAFIVAIIVFGLGTGGFKPNISPLIAEQIPLEKLRVTTTKKGERVIVDPAVTSARIYNWFYLFIDIGALVGQITMAYAALYVGYWLAYLLPTAMFLGCPLVLILCKKNYRLSPPQGSLLGPAVKLLLRATKGKWSINPVTTYRNMNDGRFWEDVKPSNIPAASRPKWMTFDDAWVDEVRRGFLACTVFLWYPLYWISYNQINNNLTSQADTMQHQGVPPEIVAQLDPLALIILIPICDMLIYPALRKVGINFTPVKKITLGFITAAFAMVWAAVVQNYIYRHNECGFYPSEGLPDGSNCRPATINIWVQSGSYVLIAISEILASITSLEYAFTKAPKNMRSMVQAFALFMTAIANAIGEAMTPLSTDPLLTWNYGAFAVVSFVAGIGFWFSFRGLDAQEDELNNLPTGHVGTASQAAEVYRRSSVASEFARRAAAKEENIEKV
jgi:POT family proton-dependent oligopeptide transporter